MWLLRNRYLIRVLTHWFSEKWHKGEKWSPVALMRIGHFWDLVWTLTPNWQMQVHWFSEKWHKEVKWYAVTLMRICRFCDSVREPGQNYWNCKSRVTIAPRHTAVSTGSLVQLHPHSLHRNLWRNGKNWTASQTYVITRLPLSCDCKGASVCLAVSLILSAKIQFSKVWKS